ncbi:hypothetical protein [Kitasatospora sp. NBC_00070]|uniref:hypothetical protein n=1 Tax=Kitasatospora sp. NBC_00070 TaxID=2975962 RepID=UPI0038600AFE
MVTCTAACAEPLADGLAADVDVDADALAPDDPAALDGLAALGLAALGLAAAELTAGVGVPEADPPPAPLEQAAAVRASRSTPRTGRSRGVCMRVPFQRWQVCARSRRGEPLRAHT